MISRIKILLGVILTAASFGLIIIPNSYCSAGVTGLARIVSNMLPISLSVCVLILNSSFLLISLLILGLKFTINTLAVSLLFPVFLDIFTRIHIEAGFIPSPLHAVFAGIVLGSGVALILSGNGSSGGFDILGIILNQKLGIEIPLVMGVCDTIVIIIQAITKPSVIPIIYGLTVILVSNLAVKILTKKTCVKNETTVTTKMNKFKIV